MYFVFEVDVTFTWHPYV